MRSVAILLGLVVMLAANSGCNGLGAMPKEFGRVMEKVANSTLDQAEWQTMAASIDGQVIEPGVEVSAGILYVARARMLGVSGRVGLNATGVGTGEGPSDEARKAILAGENSAIKEAIAKAIERLLAGDAPASQPAP